MIDIESLKTATVQFIQQHQILAPFVVGALAFGESLAVISLLVPATVLLLAIGFGINGSGLNFWVIWISAAAGAFLGDWVSYIFGFHFKARTFTFWPLSKHPRLIIRGQAFFRRYGIYSVFFGRFFGPIRAVIPLLAGVFAMPWMVFQVSNATSALIWAFVWLAPGAGLSYYFQW